MRKFLMITLTTIKSQANILKNYLNQNNASITHSSCLHAISKIYGFKDWNTASASLKDQNGFDDKIIGNKAKLSSMLSAKVIEGALYQLIKLCGVDDLSKGLIVIKDITDNSNYYPIAFKLERLYPYHSKTVSCGDFKSIKDKDEAAFLSGHYLGLLIYDFLNDKTFTKQVVKADNNTNAQSEFTPRYINQQNKLRAKLLGKHIKIKFECSNPENKPTLLKVKNIIDSSTLMNDDVFTKIENALSDYYFIGDGFENEIVIYKSSHPEFDDDNYDLVATIVPVES